ncbi:hypothetical protein B0T19DRAFT_440188 [Cercophora scortea]|uniref:Uncharacterized protein n=1 Tax=Cercophora scortea TaxID=314031 RepID=A0AAE0IZJ8_9PEZI|nr:hypothetical protein B0T19DRAFT_440188 [Cercophora scortea]
MAAFSPRNSPLPPLPPAPPPPMAIPRRRPVAASPASPPAPGPIATLGLQGPSPLLSPAESFSSLLSAYSNHTSDSTPRSSTNSTNDTLDSKDSSLAVSPNLAAQDQDDGSNSKSSIAGRPAWLSGQDAGPIPGPAPADEGFRPPPPIKDPQHQRPQTPSKSTDTGAGAVAGGRTAPSLSDASPPTEQIWRRRSLKSEKNLAVPELKLVISHGSTAASAQNSSQFQFGSAPAAPAPVPVAKPRAAPLPRSSNALPGRNIRPVARQPVNPAPAAEGEEGDMGQGLSKSKTKANGLSSRSPDQAEGPPVAKEPQTTSQTVAAAPPNPLKSLPSVPGLRSPVARLPTPEYDRSDLKSAIADIVVSPVSPVSSPDLPSEAKSVVQRKAVGATSNSGLAVRPRMGLPFSPAANRERAANSNSNANANPNPNANAANATANANANASTENIPPPFSARTSPPRPGTTSPVARTGDSPRGAGGAGAGPGFGAGPSAAYRRDPAGPVRLPVSKQRAQLNARNYSTVSETGSAESAESDDTVIPRPPQDVNLNINTKINNSNRSTPPPPLQAPAEQEQETTDNPGAALFPRNWYKTPPGGAYEVMDAQPLNDRHFRCLTNHRYMTTNRQRYNPIACRACGAKDRNAECFICSGCHLNICGRCNATLRRCKGDLHQVLQLLREKPAGDDGQERTATMTQAGYYGGGGLQPLME